MFDVLSCAVFMFFYLLFRPLRFRTTVLNDMYIEYPTHMNASLVRSFAPLLEWQRNMKRGLLAEGAVCEKVSIRDVYMFGTTRVGFMLLDVTVNMNGVKLPGAVVLRGKSVAVLLWYREWGDVYVVLVRQARVATGRMTWEVPAGMADGNGSLKGQMFTEIKEETGLALNIHDLVHHASPYTSCGLLDETLELYSMQISPSAMTASTAKLGNSDEGEVITNVCAVSKTDPRTLEDGKLQILLSMVDLRE